jgi:hypothetical protein
MWYFSPDSEWEIAAITASIPSFSGKSYIKYVFSMNKKSPGSFPGDHCIT